MIEKTIYIIIVDVSCIQSWAPTIVEELIF